MRHIWSEVHKRQLWRRIWVALAEAQVDFGLVTAEQAARMEQGRGDEQIVIVHIDADNRHRIEAPHARAV